METTIQKYRSFSERYWLLLPLSYIIGSGISFDKFRLFHLMVLIFIPAVLFRIREEKVNKWELPFFAFFLWELVSLFWAADRSLSYRYLFCLGNGFILILFSKYLFNKSMLEIQKFLKILLVFGLLIMVLGILETAGLFRWPYNLYSPSFYGKNINELLALYSTDLDGLAFFKTLPAVVFWNSNDLCFYLISTLPFLFIINLKKNWMKYCYLLLLLVILFANPSRSCLLGAMIIFTGAFFGMDLTRNMEKFLLTLFLTIIMSITFALQLNFLGSNRQNRLNSFVGSFLFYSNASIDEKLTKHLEVNNSTKKRSRYLKESLEDFKKSPILGIGAGNLLVTLDGKRQANAHNFWIEILVETGIVGASIFIFWILSWLYNIRNFMTERLAIYLSFLAMIPSALAVGSAVYQPGLWIPILLLYLFVQLPDNGLVS